MNTPNEHDMDHLFALMSRNATSATEFFKIPTGRVVELGTQLVL